MKKRKILLDDDIIEEEYLSPFHWLIYDDNNSTTRLNYYTPIFIRDPSRVVIQPRNNTEDDIH